jgi:hypothetical protein
MPRTSVGISTQARDRPAAIIRELPRLSGPRSTRRERGIWPIRDEMNGGPFEIIFETMICSTTLVRQGFDPDFLTLFVLSE